MSRKTDLGLRAACLALVISGPALVGTGRLSAQNFSRGDADNNGSLEITDGVFILNFLFIGGRAPECTPIADSNGDNQVNITDGVFILNHLFLGAPAPPPLTDLELSACRGLDPAAIARGMEIYQKEDPQGNLFSCALCHSLSPDPGPGNLTEVIRPGYTLENVLARPSYKEGERENFLAATNVCRTDWMLTDAWRENSQEYLDLVAFITSLQTSDTAPALEYEIIAPAKTGPSTGSAEAGCRLFNRSCFTCHGKDAKGSQMATGLLDDTVLELDDPDYTRTRIRLSGPNPTDVYHPPPGMQLLGTTMPFWTRDKMSDQEVEDIVAYVLAARQAAKGGGAFTCDAEPGGGNVIRRGVIDGRFTGGGARLPTTAHGVGGTIEELDTRKIRLTNFNYDGGGIVVKVYLFKDPAGVGQGVPIGQDLFRPGEPYVNATIVVDIPNEVADNYDHAAIWCVSAKQDFGSAELKAILPPPPAQ